MIAESFGMKERSSTMWRPLARRDHRRGILPIEPANRVGERACRIHDHPGVQYKLFTGFGIPGQDALDDPLAVLEQAEHLGVVQQRSRPVPRPSWRD